MLTACKPQILFDLVRSYNSTPTTPGGNEPWEPTDPPTKPGPDEPTVDIPDPDVPEEPTVDIDEPKVPLTDVPGEEVELGEPEVPLGDAPKTGDVAPVVGLVGLMAAAVIGLAITRRKLN